MTGTDLPENNAMENKEKQPKMLDRRFCIAPMMECGRSRQNTFDS
jgi:hypothetical protein